MIVAADQKMAHFAGVIQGGGRCDALLEMEICVAPPRGLGRAEDEPTSFDGTVSTDLKSRPCVAFWQAYSAHTSKPTDATKPIAIARHKRRSFRVFVFMECWFGSNRNRRFDARMRVVAAELKILELEIPDILHAWI